MSPFSRRPRRGRATLPVCLAIVFAGLALLLAELWYLQHRRQDSARARAEELASARLAVAQEQMARGNWDEAVRLSVDGVVIADAGTPGGLARFTRTMTAGEHEVKLEYVELTGNA